MTAPRTPRLRRRCLAVLLVSGLVTAGCGSSLSDAEILARSGEVSSSTDGGRNPSGDPAGGSATTVAGGSPSTDTANGDAGRSPTPQGNAPAASPAAPGGPCTTTGSGPVLIGNVGDYTGPAGSSLATWPQGLQVWAASVNAKGGLCGRRVQVLVQDAAGDPARNASLTRKLIESDKVTALVGSSAVLSGLGPGRILEESRIPVIGDAGATPEVYRMPTALPQGPEPRVLAAVLATLALKATPFRKVGFLSCSDAATCAEFRAGMPAAVEAGGGELAYNGTASITQIDFTAECQAAQQKGVDLFISGMDAASTVRIARSCARQGYFPQWGLGSSVVTETTLQERGLERSLLLSTGFAFAGDPTPQLSEFRAALNAYSPRRPSGGLASGWASGKMFELVARRAAAADGDITPESLRRALLTVKDETFGGLTPALTMGPDGVDVQPCGFVLQGDGKGGYVTPIGPNLVC